MLKIDSRKQGIVMNSIAISDYGLVCSNVLQINKILAVPDFI